MKMFEPWKILLFLEMLAGGGFAREINFGSSKNLIAHNQVYYSKKERFIKFDTKGDEVEIELGISIPVVKVPLAGRQMGKKDTAISVSGPGLLVAWTLIILTSFVIPALFSSKRFGSIKTDKEEFWKRVDRMGNIFGNLHDSSTCVGGLVCMAARKSRDFEGGITGKWLDAFFQSSFFRKFISGTFVEEAISYGKSGSECWDRYCDCPAVKKLHVKEGYDDNIAKDFRIL